MSDDRLRYGYERHIGGAKARFFVLCLVGGVIVGAAGIALLSRGTWYGWAMLVGGTLAALIGVIPLDARILGKWYAFRYGVAQTYSQTAYVLYTAGFRDSMRLSPRAAVVSQRFVQLDFESFETSQRKNLPRYTPRRERIWGFFSTAHIPDGAIHPLVGMAGTLRLLDVERKPWSDVERLASFAFAISKAVAGRDAEDAILIGELTAAWCDSGQEAERAIALFHEYGADVAKLVLQGFPLEYAAEMTCPLGAEAW